MRGLSYCVAAKIINRKVCEMDSFLRFPLSCGKGLSQFTIQKTLHNKDIYT